MIVIQSTTPELTDVQLERVIQHGDRARKLAHEIRQLREFCKWITKVRNEAEAREVDEPEPTVIMQAPGTELAPIMITGPHLDGVQSVAYDLLIHKHGQMIEAMRELKKLGGKR